MKGLLAAVVILGLAVVAILLRAQAQKPVQRFGMVIGIKPDKISAYEALHAASNPGIRDLLGKYHMHNFTIYIHQLDNGQYYEFGYYEYTGNDLAGDRAKMAKEPRNIEWLSHTDPLQTPLPGEKGWSMMQEVFHNQ